MELPMKADFVSACKYPFMNTPFLSDVRNVSHPLKEREMARAINNAIKRFPIKYSS
jgi:hypothetical protein